MIKVTAESRRRYGKQKFCSGKRWNLSSIDGASSRISLRLPKANSNSLQDHGVKASTKEAKVYVIGLIKIYTRKNFQKIHTRYSEVNTRIAKNIIL